MWSLAVVRGIGGVVVFLLCEFGVVELLELHEAVA